MPKPEKPYKPDAADLALMRQHEASLREAAAEDPEVDHVLSMGPADDFRGVPEGARTHFGTPAEDDE